jgi:putative peptide zinc metalloprotease protein
LAFISNSLQLMPLLELDGYYILVDVLEKPLLRARALAFVRADLWRKLRAREPFDREERMFAIYGVLALGYSAFALGAAVYFWEHRFQRLLLDAWTQESVVWRLLVGVVLVAFGGPLAFGLALKLKQLLLTTRHGLAHVRYRGEAARAQARLDARELVGKLRFLAGLSVAERETVVSQLALERFRAGAYVVRQGAPNDRFYLIRQGQAEVVQVDPDDWPRDLAVLRRGDYFGELGLLHHRPASASVRALTPLEVYTLGRPAFEMMIAPRLRDYGVTVQWIEARAELARMPLFRQTAAAELDPILEHLQASEYPAGAVIVRQADPHDRFYLIRRGRVQMSVQVADGQGRMLAELGPGASFGEVALLTDRLCPATVRALEPVSLWSLDQASFDTLLLRELQLAGALTTASAERAAACRHLLGADAA